MRVKYIETSPVKRELIFANSSDFWKFYSEYHDALWEKYCKDITDFRTAMETMERTWQKEYFKITKKGVRGKPHNTSQLRTPEALTKQKINWRASLDRKIKERQEIKEQLKQKEEEIKKTLEEQGYDIKKIEIKVREK
jgi:hypothetical protein